MSLDRRKAKHHHPHSCTPSPRSTPDSLPKKRRRVLQLSSKLPLVFSGRVPIRDGAWARHEMPPNTPGATPLFKNTGLSKSANKRHSLRLASGHNSKGSASPSYQVRETDEAVWGSDCTKKRLRFFVRTPLLRLNSSLIHRLRTAPSMVVHGLGHVSNSNHRARPKHGRGRARTQRNTYTPVTWGEINLK